MQNEPNIPWSDLTKFVGQLNHDLRNHLNAIELQSAFLNELAPEGEMKAEVKRLREMTGELGAQLQRLSSSLAAIRLHPMRYLLRDLVEDLEAKLKREQPEQAGRVKWEVSLGEEAMEMDPTLLESAFLELFRNAALHGEAEAELTFSARAVERSVEFTLRETKKNFEGTTESWGERPLRSLRHGHYGLGLYRVRSIFEAHHGHFRAQFEAGSSTLVTIVSLPLLAA